MNVSLTLCCHPRVFRLEELRRLNYSLDVELQKEKSDRMKLEVKVMSPRFIQAQASKLPK